MSNYYPLQPGDRSTTQSRTDSSSAADRRKQEVESVESKAGTNSAPGHDEPMYPLYKVGYLTPSEFLVAPFTPVLCEGDTSGEGTKCYEVDVDSYGDCYDSTAPARVRDVSGIWHMDTDHDGKVN